MICPDSLPKGAWKGGTRSAHNPGERVVLRDACLCELCRFLSSGPKGVSFLVFWEISGIFLSLYDWISPYGSYSPVLFLLGFLYISSKVLHGLSPVSVNAIFIMLQYSVWLPTFSFCWQLVDLTIPSSFSKTHSRHLYVFVSRIYMSLKYQGPNPTWHINPVFSLTAVCYAKVVEFMLLL